MVTTTINVGAATNSLALSPDGLTLYATSPRFNLVHIIDTATNSLVTSVAVTGNPTAVAVTPDNTTAYITCVATDNVVALDTTTNTLLPGVNITVGDAPEDIVILPGMGYKAFVANSRSNNVSVIDTDPASMMFNTVVATVSAGSNPLRLALTPSGAKLYAVNANTANVSVIDTATNSFLSNVSIGSLPQSRPYDASSSPDGTEIYVVNLIDGVNNVSIIEVASDTVIANVTTGQGSGSASVATADI